jgi:hypothetical protein
MTDPREHAAQLTGKQILLGGFDVVYAHVELLLAEGFDAIEIRGVRFVEDKHEPEPYLSPLEAEARAAEAWYAAHADAAE